MMRTCFLFLCLTLVVAHAADRPNILFILSDDLGYGEIGRYGQKMIATPNVDRLAKEGMTFTQFYAGNTVCAPSRSVLMTGLDMGHTRVRGNSGRDNPPAQQLQPGDLTVARVLQQAGYFTGLIGKWGLGLNGTSGEPQKMGFDYYFGFLNQTHAHNHYPDFLWRNGERVPIPNIVKQIGPTEGTGYATKRVAYANDLFFEDANRFLTSHRSEPFFLYLALTTPHANGERARALGDGNEVPDYEPYVDRSWNDSQKGHAAMITRMDRQIGELLAHLKELGLDENTLVIFSSDNGAHREGGPHYDPEFFNASGPLRGIKRDLYEGGIREPFIARWTGRIKPDTTSGYVGYFGDMMATFAELAQAKIPDQLDSISIVPTLLGREGQKDHAYLYWEFYEKGVSQALLLDGHWKAVRLRSPEAPIQLYDLAIDLGEKNDVAQSHPEIVARMADLLRTAHVDNEYWKLSAPPAAAP